jgi:4-aminobutyrate aminotransferase-like enzyme
MRPDLKPFAPGDDALTFGSWPVSMAAALAAIDVLEQDDLLTKCRDLGAHASERLREMQQRHRLIGDIRGPGLMIGVELVEDRITKAPAVEATNEIYRRGLERGVIFGTSRYGGIGNVIKVKPSLTVTRVQLDRALDVLDELLGELEAES